MKVIYILALLTFLNFKVFASNCSKLKDDCEYYLCIEKIKHCGEKGYFINFGHYYCNKFEIELKNPSSNLVNFLNDTRSCLIESIETIPIDTDCRKFKKKAFKDHVSCYVESGFCELSSKHKRKIISIIKNALWRPRLFTSGLKVISQCKSKKL